MTHDMDKHNVNVNLTKQIKLNPFKDLKDQTKPKNNKRTKIKQTNKLED